MDAARPFWDDENVPGPGDPELLAFVNCEDRREFRPSLEQCRSWGDAPNPKTYASFGDNGTTATVSAYGNIVQFDTYIGEGHSGMFSADHGSVQEPYLVEERTRGLQNVATTSVAEPDEISNLYGLRLSNIKFDALPKQSWVNYRWPRYEFEDKGLKQEESSKKAYTVQWMVYDNVLLQHCTVENLDDTELSVDLEFLGTDSANMWIRDLDHIDPEYKFNEHRDNYTTSLGLHGYSWVLAHKLEASKADGISGTEARSETNEIDNIKPHVVEASSIAVVVSVFLNGKTLKWDEPDQWKVKLPSKPNTKDSGESLSLTPGNAAEIVIAYKMILTPISKAHWRDFLIPASYTNIGELIEKEPVSDISLTSLFCGIGDDTQGNANESRRKDGVDKTMNINSETRPTSPTSPVNDTPLVVNPSGLPSIGSSPGIHIEYIVRRNLEHILSACAIPLARRSLELEDEKVEEPVPVALTCGPMSFHRLTASSSYFSYQFLLEITQRLQQSTLGEKPYVKWLMKRISSVCRGHLRWISKVAQKAESGHLAGNYWVTGKVIDQESPSWRPDNSLTDNPFHILKAGNYAAVFPEDKSTSIEVVRDMYIPWLRNLEEQDKRNCFAWPHAHESDINVFRLDDHVWIWKALKVIDELGLWTMTDRNQTMSGETATDSRVSMYDDIRRWSRIYEYRNVQREMLRRFTTESEVSRKRMLAVTRSPRETRFLFHARDTVLFYEFDNFLLPETSFRPVWENTIEAQKHHDDNQETRWDNALRYALSILMGTRGYSINKEKSPRQLVETSLHTLLKISSHNGLFTGQLDETMKEPCLFYREADRDFYFHASFEIPFVILTRAHELGRESQYDPEKYTAEGSSATSNPPKRTKSEEKHDGHQQKALNDDIVEFSERLTAQPKRQLVTNELEALASENNTSTHSQALAKITQVANHRQSMKKIMPVNRFIDSNSIIDIPEEWLYNYPPFLSNEKPLLPKNVHEVLAKFLIDSRGFNTIIDLMTEDADLAVSIVRVEEKLRNKFCNALACDTETCIVILEDKDNEDIRKSFTGSLGPDLEPFVQEFLQTGKVPRSSLTGRFSDGGSISSKLTLNRFGPRRSISEFLGTDEVIDKLYRVFLEETGALLRKIHKFSGVRKWLRFMLFGETDFMVRTLLHEKSVYNKVRSLLKEDEGIAGQTIVHAAIEYLNSMFEQESGSMVNYWLFKEEGIDRAAVVDTKKKTTQGKRAKTITDSQPAYLTNVDLWSEHLNRSRTAGTAKKRLIYLPKANAQSALACVLGSPESERQSMSTFFDRHRNYNLYFFDDTTMSLNTWETELHLSFYQLSRTTQSVSAEEMQGIPRALMDVLPGGKDIEITKASVGFRFSGDFFDRYWTCHVIEFVPAKPEWESWEFIQQFAAKDRSLRQRKVLELSLFGRCLDMLASGTREILETLKLELGVSHGAFSFIDLRTGDYFSMSDQWQESQHALQALEDHLEHVISAIIDKWDTREKDRGTEKPRWTRSDEWKYRGVLKKLLAANNSKVRDIQSLHAEIKTLREFLGNRQDQIRNDLSLFGAENIRFFTYVTVVFLPLGFAASIFSMSETPDGLLISHMAATAAVSLVLTVFALVNAEKLGAATGAVSRAIAKHSDLQMKKSQFLHHYRASKREVQASKYGANTFATGTTHSYEPDTSTVLRNKTDKPDDTRRRGRPNDKNSWHPWFWILYMIIELPARRAALAYRALQKPKPTLSDFYEFSLGVLVLPWCVVIWLLQLIVINLSDLVHMIKYQFRRGEVSAKGSSQQDLFGGNVAWLLRPPIVLRPFLRADFKPRENTTQATQQKQTGPEEVRNNSNATEV
ncbi:hypothetical protein BKA67DRAFT_665085 [Truncatella angustata]|uniref:Uncharacterized protein n=1 Tax=Truncatella angustata TaxID=152316 RepID=A0A9P8UAV6_9PEZI|nr:uncharacterized protein BKA67DRAFT_665085 [Truncatella angustata]KAH6643260.1 hypothetical protein BKA67DRAFT_665085 [Truncatella angustata]